MAAAGGWSKLDMIEHQQDKIWKALKGIAAILDEVLQAPRTPELREYNPILSKMKEGKLISHAEFQILNDFSDAKKFNGTDGTHSHILTAFQGMVKKCVTKQNKTTYKLQIARLDVWDALGHLAKISKLKNDEAVGVYFNKDFIDAIKAK